MNITAIPDSLLQQIGNSATQTGDAVSISVMRKALDMQASQAARLIDSVTHSMPDPSSPLGQNINVKA